MFPLNPAQVLAMYLLRQNNIFQYPVAKQIKFIFLWTNETSAIRVSNYLRDFVEVSSNQFFLLNEFYVLKGFSCQFNSLIKTIFTAVRHVHQFDNFRLQSLWKSKKKRDLLTQLISRAAQVLVSTQRTGSNISDWLSSVLKSALPAKIRPAIFGLSFVMNNCVATSATLRT